MRAGAVATLEMQIIADVARLQKDMRAMEKVVDAATGGMGTSFNRAGAAASQMARDAQLAAGGIGRTGESGKLARHHVQNLAFQFNDLGVQMAMAAQSSKPVQMMMMALMQQGSQIGGIMGQAGIGVRGLATEVGGMVGRFASAHPYLTAFAVVMGAMAAATKVFTSELNSSRSTEIDTFTQSLGLSKKELEKLGPVSITFGDTIKGLGRTIQEYLGIDAANILKGFKDLFSGTFKAVGEISMVTTAGIYAGFVGTFNAVKDTWSLLPAALGDAAYSAANLTIKALNFLLERGTAYINAWSLTINSVMSKIPGMGGMQIQQIKAPKIDALANPYAGAAAKAGNAAAGAYSKAFNDAMAGQRGFFAKVGDNAFAAMQERVRAQADKLRGDDKGSKPKADKHAEALAREIESIEAAIRGLHELADAYMKSDEAALRAEASAKAHEQAIRKQGDYATFYALELRRIVAERTMDASKSIADLRKETDTRAILNNQIAQGLITSEQAQALMKSEMQLRPLLAALALAEGDEKLKLADRIRILRDELKRSNDEREREQSLQRSAQLDKQTAALVAESRLTKEIGERRLALMSSGNSYAAEQEALRQLNLEQERRLILLRAEAQIKATPTAGPKEIASIMAKAQEEMNAVDMRGKLDGAVEAMSRLRDLSKDIDFAGIFGRGGEAIEGMIGAVNRLNEAQVAYNLLRDNENPEVRARAERDYSKSKINGTLQILSASKKFFKEESAGYKMIMALEKALALIELVNTIKSIALDTTKTGSSVGNAMARGAADQAAGAAKMFSFLGPFAFPVVAAMIALLATLGLGGGKGASAPTIPTAGELQEAAGTGSVLGDAKAKSNSIANSLEIVASNSNRDLEYSNAMLKALRSIDVSIAKLAGTVAQQITVSGGMFDTSGRRLGESGNGGFLGLFKTKVTRELWDLGMTLNSANVAQILQNGITGQTYQIIQQIKEKSGFLGIGGGTSTTYETTTGQIDPAITGAIQNVIFGLREGLLSAAKVVGLDGAAALIDNFNISIGKLSFKDMTGEEIEQQLNAVFSKVGDEMAAAILPGLREIQKVGEGLFETFMRAARQYQVVDTALKSIGMTFGSVGVGSLAARDHLVQLFESLDEFVSQTEYYRDNFLTEAEQVAPIYAAVQAELARLGLATVDTMDEFKGVVSGLDLTTDAGRTLYAALMALAPAFATVEKFQEKEAKLYSDRADGLRAYLAELTGGTSSSLARIAARFRSTSAAAALGDATALDNLKGASQDYLAAMKDRAGTLVEYQRARAQVLNSVNQGIAAADSMAIAKRTMVAVETLSTQVTQLRSENNALQMQIAENTSAAARLLNRSTDADSSRVSNDADTPLHVDLVA